MTATVLNTKISEVENKIPPNASNFVTTTVLNTTISEVENKIPNHCEYITTPEKMFDFNFSKANTKVYLNLHYNVN